MQFGPLTLKQCRYGWMLFAGPFIGRCFGLYGEYSESEVAMMRRFVRPGDTVIDVGASLGDLTLPLSQMVGPEGRVYAIESRAEDCHILSANLALNQIVNVRPLNVYVKDGAASPVTERFFSKYWTPPSLRLDELELPECRLIKIDVDGAELDVLKSGADTIKRLRPVLYLENDIKAASKSLIDYLFGIDYRLYWHLAPIFSPNNFFNFPVNYWYPKNIMSLMMLGLPKEQNITVEDLPEVVDADEWPGSSET
jgi:hypothetical protein